MLDNNVKLKSVLEITKKLGRITGRDGIYLDETSFKNERILILKGEINGQLCSVSHEARWIGYEIKFKGVVYQKMFDSEKFSGAEEFDSNITQKIDSELITSEVREKSHFVVITYDYYIEVVASSIELTVLATR